jgi:hypothetical protein
VSGVVYLFDSYYQLWTFIGLQWIVIGNLTVDDDGQWVALLNDGTTFPVVCE